MIDYNKRKVYDGFNNPFPDGSGIPAMNISPIRIYDKPLPHKRSHYTPYLLPVAISIVSEDYVITFTSPYYFPRLLLLPSGDTNPPHAMKKGGLFLCRGENRILL